MSNKTMLTKTNLIFILIFVLLFSLVLIDICTSWLHFLFEPTELEQSIFSLTSSTLILFYGIIWGAFLKILGNNHLSAMLGLVLSSFTFGWIHSNHLFALDRLFALIIKTAGGFLLGSIYLIKWKKNFVAVFLAHIGENIVGVYFYVAYNGF